MSTPGGPPPQALSVTLNGEARRLASAPTVAEVVSWLRPDRRGVAVAVNGEVVPRSQWDQTFLADSDRVEVLGAAQGG